MRPILALLLMLSGCANAQPVYDRVHGATLVLKVGRAECGGTAVGQHTLLSAAHCFEGKPKTLQASGELCEVRKIESDGKDHVLVLVGGCAFKQTAKLGPAPKTGDRIFVWGSPLQYTDILRFGRVAGYQDNAMPGMGRAQIHDFNGGPGDSGSAIFNERGEIAAVASIGSRGYVLMGSFPITFTRKQWASVGL